MSAKIISLVNQKGGVGKTTSAINIAASFAHYDKRVLLIDLDPQGNASQGLNVDKSIDSTNIYDVMTTDMPITRVIQTTYISEVDVVSANINLSGADIILYEKEDSHNILKEKLSIIKNNYDYILIDCPPSLSSLTVNSLVASNSVIIPVQTEYYALEGLTQLLDTIILIKETFNEKLTIEGVLPTMYDKRLKLANDTLSDLRRFFGEKVFEPVPRTTKVATSPAYGKAMIDYDKRNKATLVYLKAAREVISYG